MFGLIKRDIDSMNELFKKYPQIEEAVIFGSRAKGNYKNGSDVDIALKGEITYELVRKIFSWLNNESPTPYYYDILDYNNISNQDLTEHIDRVGKPIYKKSG